MQKKETYEALEIIHTAAGCAYSNMLSTIGL